MTQRVAHSLIIDLARPIADVLTLARAAEEAGAHAVYVPDHFLQHTRDDTVADGPMHEGWTALTSIALATSRVRVGTLVLGATYRHPAVVANMAATLDHVSEGRLVLGLGAGWQVNEHTAYGIELPEVPRLLDRFEEHTRAIHSLLRNPRTTQTGEHFTLTDAPCQPAPLQEPLPILVGGGGEKRTMRVAAEYADAWHTWASPEEFLRKNAVLDAHCESLGRAPGAIRRVTGAWVEDVDVLDHLDSYAGSRADEVVLLDHRLHPMSDTLAALEKAAP